MRHDPTKLRTTIESGRSQDGSQPSLDVISSAARPKTPELSTDEAYWSLWADLQALLNEHETTKQDLREAREAAFDLNSRFVQQSAGYAQQIDALQHALSQARSRADELSEEFRVLSIRSPGNPSDAKRLEDHAARIHSKLSARLDFSVRDHINDAVAEGNVIILSAGAVEAYHLPRGQVEEILRGLWGKFRYYLTDFRLAPGGFRIASQSEHEKLEHLAERWKHLGVLAIQDRNDPPWVPPRNQKRKRSVDLFGPSKKVIITVPNAVKRHKI